MAPATVEPSPADMRILFLGKTGDQHCLSALAKCLDAFPNTASFLARWGDEIPPGIANWEGDFIISYLSRWILTEKILGSARVAALNFHPGPPEYPGIGCFNFALYDEAAEYGCTCHYMVSDVDSGGIVSVRRFPVFPDDDVASLMNRTYVEQERLFDNILDRIKTGSPLPDSHEQWAREPFTRKELNSLSKISPKMPSDEIRRRVRATTFEEWKPTVELGGFVFELREQQSK